MTGPLGLPLCWAGRKAFFGGRWNHLPPCEQIGRNQIGTELGPACVFLCDEHFDQVNAAGLVTEPYLDPEQFKAKYRR